MNLLASFSLSDWSVLTICFGFLLMWWGRHICPIEELTGGKFQKLDNVTLRSPKLGLVGRPSRIVKRGRIMIPEDWTIATKLERHNLARIGTYFVLIEEQFGVRPPYGYVIASNLRRYRIRNDERIRSWVLHMAANIAEEREKLSNEKNQTNQ